MASIGAGRATLGTMDPRLVIRTNSRVPAPPRLVVRAESQVPGDGKGKDDGQRRRQSGGRQYGGEHSAKSSRGFSNAKRRKGRAAHLRSPDDTPLRDGNRDRLMGLLTERAAKTLLYYMFETNPTLYGWFNTYLKVRCMSSTLDSRLSILDVCPTLSLSSCALRSFTRSLVRSFTRSFKKENEIPREGSWDDVSGETFLRKLLSLQMEETSWAQQVGVENIYNSFGGLIVDPRNVAQRVMEVRGQLAKEMIQDLQQVSEENSLLMRETLLTSLSLDLGDDEGDKGVPDV